MAANTSPIFVLTPQSSWATLATANTDTSMSTGTSYLLFTAGANGGKVEQINCVALATAAACLVRIFVNNGSSTGSSTNNSLVLEIPLAANTESQIAANVAATVTTNIYLASGYKLYATVSAISGGSIQVTAQGGSF